MLTRPHPAPMRLLPSLAWFPMDARACVPGGIDPHNLPAISEHYVVLRCDGSLNFVNVAYFEEGVLQALERFPRAQVVLVGSSGINDLDVSGEEKLLALAEQLRARNVTLSFSSLRRQVLAAFGSRGLFSVIPGDHIFKTKEVALKTRDACYGGRRGGPALSGLRPIFGAPASCWRRPARTA
jgi:SulP family sulfate permease